eukprot:TRINITY_DN39271_c0_g1_i1.p1 TRINITY_DN39271_c0_g1~~TRINITY_DN39271_c0_g1_i1.p1  ORF type:complete len:411 (-),score=77.81 TRINITY_DN39271_c0_g1_i1:111-1343(-)
MENEDASRKSPSNVQELMDSGMLVSPIEGSGGRASSSGGSMTARGARSPMAVSGAWTLTPKQPARLGVPLASGGYDPGDANDLVREAAEARFFDCQAQKDKICAARSNYPRRKPSGTTSSRAREIAAELLGQDEDKVPRRIPGFKLGFEKVFATTSMTLPASAYTVFVELRSSHHNESWSRVFNGLATVFDLRKWIYEKMLLPSNSYELSYAEAGKATLTDELRLLTTQDSLDTRTLATTRAAQGFIKGISGVHSIGDIGVSRLYVRLKCRTCGDSLNSFQTCRKLKQFGTIDAPRDYLIPQPQAEEKPKRNQGKVSKFSRGGTPGYSACSKSDALAREVCIEDGWYAPDENKHCLFHTHGYELFQAARAHGGYADVARIFLSCGKEPSKMLNVGEKALSARNAPSKISY